MKSFYSHGKLLLTGEYVVLDGATSLAIPTGFGQSLDIQKANHNHLIWKSFDENDQIWFETEFNIYNQEILKAHESDDPISNRLLQILNAALKLNPKFLVKLSGYDVTTKLDFPRDWGLGTSSTLINNLASWANVNPYSLLDMTFGGSGYDIACASANRSLTYELHPHHKSNNQPVISDVAFYPSFHKHLYFIYLNQKQNSRDGISQYRANTSDLSVSISRISAITKEVIKCETLIAFQHLLNEHEQLISEIIKQTPIKQRLFNDFKGSIKSLGAWGGDFILVASDVDPTTYFKSKGYPTILQYSEMVKY
ncbi:Mevalonate kinase [Formosa sp. Hel1_31_208]|uniref:GYDIA family GHMP kinase n=1 Tax=Formosa sp. Hel1_31_208 TaxID=1798225 RepID=UPI0008793306|nr:GYDIA family GHMP kinase [Formosa sp. Hel1_31_208]SDR88875.1 Mevalonate kinase [Formosa sp. Hel1_31_208]